MGARISVQFNKDGEKSVVLFNHWGGEEFADETRDYVNELRNEVKESRLEPLDRLEPNTVMVDFIRHLTQGEKRVKNSLYLGATEEDGDNSDYGHHVIDL